MGPKKALSRSKNTATKRHSGKRASPSITVCPEEVITAPPAESLTLPYQNVTAEMGGLVQCSKKYIASPGVAVLLEEISTIEKSIEEKRVLLNTYTDLLKHDDQRALVLSRFVQVEISLDNDKEKCDKKRNELKLRIKELEDMDESAAAQGQDRVGDPGKSRALLVSEPDYYLYLAPKNQVPPAVAAYQEMAERMQQDSATMMYINALWEGFVKGTNEKAFNALCVPSGTGKTQLAFALPKDKCACIYFNTGFVKKKPHNRQHIYEAFDDYMEQFMHWLEEDYDDNEGKFFWLYGFLRALMRLLIKHPGLNLPGDLARLRVSSDNHGEPITKAMKGDVVALIETWSQSNGGKQLVLFIDEFTAIDNEIQSRLAFLRRRFMDTHCCVVVASTDSGAMNMFRSTAATPDSRQSVGRPWVYLCTQLPKYVAEPALVASIERCECPQLRRLLQLCIESRPLFAETVRNEIRAFLDNRGNDPVKLFETLRERLLAVIRTKETALSLQGCIGYVMASLLAGKALISGDKSQSSLFGDLSTKNWAYLVNDATVIPDPDNAKQRKLGLGDSASSRDAMVELSCKQRTPPFILLWRIYDPGEDSLNSVKNGKKSPFNCLTFFPTSTEDFLLYLVLVGSDTSRGLFVAPRKQQKPYRISVARLLHDVFKTNRNTPSSPNAIAPNFALHETLVSAAFYSACNSGSLSGCSLEELVTRFVADLITSRRVPYPLLKTVAKINWINAFKAKFVFPYDTKLPSEVHAILGTTELTRPAKEMSADGALLSLDATNRASYGILLEAKSTINAEYVKNHVKRALKCQDSNARVSFIVVDKTPENPEQKLQVKHTEFETLDRSNKVGRKLAKAGTLEARAFLVDIDEELRVVLKPLDGRPLDEESDRLIFVICLQGLNDKFH